jgi:hypothetical protein
MQTLAEQWKEILAHLKSLRAEKDAPDYRKRRRHREQGPSQVVNAYANAEIRRHKNQHRG